MLGGYSSCSSAWTIADVIVIRFFGITKIPWRAGRRGMGLGGSRGKESGVEGREGGGKRVVRCARGGAHTPPGKGACWAPSCATCGLFVGTVVCHEPKRGGVCARPGQSRAILGGACLLARLHLLDALEHVVAVQHLREGRRWIGESRGAKRGAAERLQAG